MEIKLLTPKKIIARTKATRIRAEAHNGSFTLLPLHIDFISALAPGILIFEDESGAKRYFGIDEAIIVKLKQEVMVATPRAFEGRNIDSLRSSIEEELSKSGESDKKARSAIARMESDIVRRFMELNRS